MRWRQPPLSFRDRKAAAFAAALRNFDVRGADGIPAASDDLAPKTFESILKQAGLKK